MGAEIERVERRELGVDVFEGKVMKRDKPVVGAVVWSLVRCEVAGRNSQQFTKSAPTSWLIWGSMYPDSRHSWTVNSSSLLPLPPLTF